MDADMAVAASATWRRYRDHVCDGGFSAVDHELYRSATARAVQQLGRFLRRGDLAVLQTLGTAPHVIAAGVRVAWRALW